jgi:hypothetical protein
VKELTEAEDYQRKARRRLYCRAARSSTDGPPSSADPVRRCAGAASSSSSSAFSPRSSLLPSPRPPATSEPARVDRAAATPLRLSKAFLYTFSLGRDRRWPRRRGERPRFAGSAMPRSFRPATGDSFAASWGQSTGRMELSEQEARGAKPWPRGGGVAGWRAAV